MSKEITSLASIKTYQAGAVQTNVHRSLKKITERSLSHYGLTTMQWYIIGAIYDAGDDGISLTLLSKSVHTTLAYLTNTINILEARSILRRSDHTNDSRSKLLTVEKSYHDTVAKIETEMRHELRKEIYTRVSPAELTQYINVLYKMSGTHSVS